MTDLLTHAEYQAIAEDMNLPRTAFIDGKFRAAKSKKTFDTVNPATGKTIAKVAACAASDVDFYLWGKMEGSSRRNNDDDDETEEGGTDGDYGQQIN